MTMSGAEMAELVAVLADAGMDADGIADACARVAAASVVRVEALARPRSKAALRTARWRARRKGANVTDVTVCDGGDAGLETPQVADMDRVSHQVVTLGGSGVTSQASPNVTDVTVATKKKSPPHPLKKKLSPLPPKGGAPQSSQPNGLRVHILNTDPVFGAIEALRGKPMPSDERGGWRFDVGEIERARVWMARPMREAANDDGKVENSGLETAR